MSAGSEMSSYSDTLEALSKAATARPWYPAELAEALAAFEEK